MAAPGTPSGRRRAGVTVLALTLVGLIEALVAVLLVFVIVRIVVVLLRI